MVLFRSQIAWNAYVKHGNAAQFEHVLEVYARPTTAADEKRRALTALGRTRDAALLARTLEWSLAPGNVRLQDWPLFFGSLGSHAAGRTAAWAFAQAHWDIIDKATSSTSFLQARVVDSLVSGIDTAAGLTAAEAFFQTHPVPMAERTLKQAAEGARLRLARLARDGPALAAWLASTPAARV